MKKFTNEKPIIWQFNASLYQKSTNSTCLDSNTKSQKHKNKEKKGKRNGISDFMKFLIIELKHNKKNKPLALLIKKFE